MLFIHKHIYKETNIIGYYYKYDLYSQLKNLNLFYVEGIFWSICAFLYKKIQIIKYIFLRSFFNIHYINYLDGEQIMPILILRIFLWRKQDLHSLVNFLMICRFIFIIIQKAKMDQNIFLQNKINSDFKLTIRNKMHWFWRPVFSFIHNMNQIAYVLRVSK